MSPFEKFSPIVDAEVRRAVRTHRHISKDDLRQEAQFALVQALARYDLTDPEIGGRIRVRVRGALVDFVRAQTGIKSGRIRNVVAVTDSFDAREPPTDYDLRLSSRAPSGAKLVEDDQCLRAVLARVPPRLRRVLSAGLKGVPQETLAKRLGCSPATVSRLFQEATEYASTIRAHLENGTEHARVRALNNKAHAAYTMRLRRDDPTRYEARRLQKNKQLRERYAQIKLDRAAYDEMMDAARERDIKRRDVIKSDPEQLAARRACQAQYQRTRRKTLRAQGKPTRNPSAKSRETACAASHRRWLALKADPVRYAIYLELQRTRKRARKLAAIPMRRAA